MPNVAMTVGFDGAGDACVYFNIHDEGGNHIRYATEDEIERYLCKLSEADAEPLPEDLGICVTCGGECSDEGTCEDACIDCGEHYPEGGDGYDGRCPACADAIEEDDDEEDEDDATN